MKTCPQCESGYADSLVTCPTHGMVLNEIRDLKPGMVIHGTYRIARKLGQGGMGSVYLADHTLMHEPVALKFLSEELSLDEAFTARFLREVRTLKQVRHRNVVDAGSLEPAEDGTLFFPMEFVDGPNLRDFLRDAPKPFDVKLALEITRGIADGLGAAHVRGMVHRDIKPENILLAHEGEEWVPKIADFGIVATKEERKVTLTGSFLLTPFYAAPEQWRGTRAAELDGRTDFYALGGVLYEMLTGERAFNAENYHGWSQQHLTVTPRSPGSLRPDLVNWKGLDELVLQLLAKDLDKRPGNTAELLSLIDAVVYVPPREKTNVAELADARMNGPDESPKPAKHAPPWVWVAALVVIGVGIFAAGRLLKPKPPESAQNVSQATSLAAQPQASAKEGQPAQIPPAKTIETKDTASKRSDPKVVVSPAPKPVERADAKSINHRAVALFNQESYAEAAPLFEQACNEGASSACNRLGYMYQNHLGMSRDTKRASALFTKACDGGTADGCTNLGLTYWKETPEAGTAPDYSRQIELFSRACDGGSALGCSYLGAFYNFGWGVPQDVNKAISLYERACDELSGRGCFELGSIYKAGKYAGKDVKKAKPYLDKACSLGYRLACDDLKLIQ